VPERKARVFISHSAQEDAAREIQEALYEALKELPGLVPLMDRTDLEPGDMWRSRINLWVGGCDAAVILLSGKALLSDWVVYEAALLSYRRERDPGFLVVPVYVGVDDEAIKKSRLRPTEITAIQAVYSVGRPVPDVVAEIVKALEKAVCCGDSPVERRAKRLASLLAGFRDDQLRTAADFIHYDLNPWLPAHDARLFLAVQLQCVGMKAAVPALLNLQESLPASVGEQGREDWLQKVVDLVASSWVDHRNVERIPPIAKGLAPPCAVSLNAASPITAQMYVLRSSTEEPAAWKLVSCSGVVGQDRIEETISELSGKVAQTLAAELKCRPEEVAEKLKKRNWASPRPLFISLPGAGITDEILAALRKAFPHVVFFLLMGDTPVEGPLLTDAMLEDLFPQLVLGDEQIFLDDYDSFKESVRP
jgi:hypothetical protein